MRLTSLASLILSVLIFTYCNRAATTPQPLSLHPRNPHYFLFRDQPAILIGSTEHYGAVMNLDFDYVKYLDELKKSGLNVTRTFSGIYVEPQGVFGIERNTLAPAKGRFICPWARSSEEGYANGGNKFDLTRWDDKYFTRLKDFINEAGKRDIIVELDLFSNFYDTVQWKLSPLYSGNNVNSTGNFEDHREVLSLRHPDILDVQEKMVRKIAEELRDFDNLYYEVCNEPYFGDTLALREWESHMNGIVADAEKDFRYRHLISNNIANNFRFVPEPRNEVSIYNFHYASPPVTVGMNYNLDRVIGDNETGFDGIKDTPYRIEAWNFILAGGGLFNNLDYSFTAGSEDGTFIFGKGQPGGGGKTLRNQFRILAEFVNSLDYINMKPITNDLIRINSQTGDAVHGIYEAGKAMALCFSRKDTAALTTALEINLPAGSYTLTWIDTKTADTIVSDLSDHSGGWAVIKSPAYNEDIALKVLKSE